MSYRMQRACRLGQGRSVLAVPALGLVALLARGDQKIVRQSSDVCAPQLVIEDLTGHVGY